MILVENTLGNILDDNWRARLQGTRMDWVNLDQWEAQKSRIRKISEQGTEVAMSLSRGVFLRDGDILTWDEAANTVVAARIHVREVMVIRLDGLADTDPALVMRTCVELGHALGNQHWPAVVKDGRVFVPLTIDRKVMASVMKTHAFQGIQYDFVPGSEVIPYLAPHESRLLFGGSEGPSHTHSHDHGHGHSHEHEDAHGHRH